MSYRTRINDVQIFGNNETYPEWDEFIKSQGIAIDEEGCYDGEIHDFHAMIATIESIVTRLMSERRADWEKEKHAVEKLLAENPENPWAVRRKSDLTRSYLDFSAFEKDLEGDYRNPLLDVLFQIATETYAFFPYAAYLACRDQVELKDAAYEPDGRTMRIRNYAFRPGMSAHVHAG